ncbi:hypothetical protein KPL71_000995 [Citrus sinensis]|uniref:Uncharacterized protein n=1 Tax=Citrus sinensis TaxID=2711 RepID=A0ACB8NU17_CITSI|nr:hypothetical protein KPL71_000995 [Citrus sinensis]
MPGTILVSVLEFKGLQSSSSMPQQMSIKVSMGKREYQTWEKTEFSFPLTTFRDNLMIALYDAKGNKISYTGVETRLVVEKGLWDDIFSLEGGGHVHLRLQFILTEDERYRIRIMRESALRKKHDELSSSNPTSPESVGSNAEASLFLHQQIYIRRIDQPPVSQGFDVHLTDVNNRGLIEKVGTQTPRDDVSVRAVGSKEASSLSKSSELKVAAKNKLIARKLEEAGSINREKQSPAEKIPSNVRNMINAFESSLSQDIRPYIKPAPAKSQLRKISSEASLTSLSADEFKTEQIKLAALMSGRIKTPFLTGEFQQATMHTRAKEDQLGYVKAFDGYTAHQGTRQFGLSPVDVRTEVKNPDMSNKNSSEGLMRESTGKAATVSGRMLLNEQQSGGKSSIKESMKGVRQEYSLEVDSKGTSINKLKYKENWKDIHYSSNCPGTWMFPTGSRNLCITAGGKHLIDLMGICHAEVEIHREEKFPAPENVEKSSTRPGCNKGNEVDESSKKARKPELVNSEDNENSRGAVGQVLSYSIPDPLVVISKISCMISTTSKDKILINNLL